MAQLRRRGHERLDRTHIGAWLFRCNPQNLAWTPEGIAPVYSRCAVRNYRLDLIRPRDPVVLWLTGPSRATPPPGVCMVGFATGDVEDDPTDEIADLARARVLLTSMSPLSTPLHRDHLRAHPPTASMEVLRQPFGPNPSYLTPVEQRALEDLIGGWPGHRA